MYVTGNPYALSKYLSPTTDVPGDRVDYKTCEIAFELGPHSAALIDASGECVDYKQVEPQGTTHISALRFLRIESSATSKQWDGFDIASLFTHHRGTVHCYYEYHG